jgi:hypothetical protein
MFEWLTNLFNEWFGIRSEFGKKVVANKVINIKASNSRGWHKTSSQLNRNTLPNRCILGPGKSFPVCNNKDHYDCKGLLAAVQRSRKGTNIHKKAKFLGKKLGCKWANKHKHKYN